MTQALECFRRLVQGCDISAMRVAIPEMFGPVKTAMIDLFDECYVVLTQAVAATVISVTGVGGSF